jgi:SAM-dependent methyltransferase
MSSDQIVRTNREGWDRLVASSHVLTRPVSAEDLQEARKIVDPVGWLEGDPRGKKVLCLAAGGGRFSSLFAALGADVTVVDISPAMLAVDRRMAQQHGFQIRAVEADMCNLPMLNDGEFDLIMQPVSTTYISEPRFAFAEAARVLKSGAIYISFHKQPVNLQASLMPSTGGYVIERSMGTTLHNAKDLVSRFREAGTIEHIHSLQILLGGICRSGFVIEDVVEPQHADALQPPGSFGHRCAYIAPYLAIKSRRVSQPRKAYDRDANKASGLILNV